MKIVIVTDLEGVCGVETMESTSRGDPGFEGAYAELAEDINAAVRGAFEGGADEVLVIDGHGAQGLDWDLVDTRAIRGDKNFFNELKKPFDALMCVGYHAMAGTPNAFLDHTQSSQVWFEYKVNGRPTGELGQCGIWAAHQNAPVIFVTGDEAAVAEAREFFGDIECVAVKRGIGRNSCETYDRETTRGNICRAAKRAVEALRNDPSGFRVYRPALPAEILLTYCRTDYADSAMRYNPSLERVGPRTVRKIAVDYIDILP